jgi:hypothetical protein
MYSKGISWIDDCRIPFVDEVSFNAKQSQSKNIDSKWGAYHNRGFENSMYKPQGRFPANILVSDDMLNDGVISSQSSGLRKNPGIKTEEWKAGHKNNIPIMTQGDKGTNSRYYDIDKWFEKLLND